MTDFERHDVDHDDVTINSDGLYCCEECGTALEPDGEVRRDDDVTRGRWVCTECDEGYWFGAGDVVLR